MVMKKKAKQWDVLDGRTRIGRYKIPNLIIAAVCAVIFVAAAGGGYFLVRSRGHEANAQTASQAASTKPITCTGDKAQSFNCWQQHYQAITANQSVAAAFTDLKAAYGADPYIKSNCHQFTHVIGRQAAKKYQDVAEAYKYGDSFCWSGYYHGVMETIAQKYGRTKIVGQLNDICKSLKAQKEYSFDHFNCVHGLGHGLMAVDNSELFAALSGCDYLEGPWQEESCYGGVFMENIMDEVNDYHHTNYLKQDDPLYPCTAVHDRYKQQCYLMQTSHALTVVSRDFNKVFALCAGVPAPYDTTCFQSLGRDASGGSVSDQTQTRTICMAGPTEAAKQNCIVGAVKDFISYYHSDKPGLALCESIDNAAISSTCKDTAVAYFKNF
jgi:hypothetical protein